MVGYHDGIDIAANRGASVFAARDGKVIFSDRLSGYGNVVIIEHASAIRPFTLTIRRTWFGQGR